MQYIYILGPLPHFDISVWCFSELFYTNTGIIRHESVIVTEQSLTYMLWFKFIFGLKFLKPVWLLFPFVSDYE